MRLLFFEPNQSGHHYAYLARMLPGFLDLPVEVVLATTAVGAVSDEFWRTLGQCRIGCSKMATSGH